MDCSPNALATASRCLCFNPKQARQVMVLLLCQWANANIIPPPSGNAPVLSDGVGGFCQLEVDVNGDVGAHPVTGPATSPEPVIADGGGGFWKVVTDGSCNRGTTSVAGPATAPVVLTDTNSVAWTLVVSSAGDLGATS